MQADDIITNRFLLESEGLNLQVFTALPAAGKPYELKCHCREGRIWSPPVFFENWRLTLDFFERLLL